ncbi:Odorant receptor 2 [Blattella germanica]|nr:Odorant receptor 2 [Blattella germanica]
MENRGESTLEKLNLLKKQYQFLHVSGILPYSSVCKSFWKTSLYNSFTILCMFYLPFTIVTFLLAIEQFGDDLDIFVSILYEVFLFMYIVFELYYWILNRKYLLKLYNDLESKFIPHITKLNLSPDCIQDSINFYNKLMIIIVIICVADIFAWAGVPFLLWCFETSEDYKNMEGNEFWKYFSNICWLPANATQTPMYQVVYSHQAFSSYLCGIHLTSCNVVMFSVIYHVATHFKLIIAALEKVDSRFLVKESKQEERYLSKKDIETNEDQSKNDKRANEDLSVTPENFKNQRSSVIDEEKIYQYLIDCVKYHQDLLEFCKEANTLMSPMLLATLVYIQISVCVPLLLVALGRYNGFAKYIVAVVEQFVMPCMICYYGDYVIEQSLNVQKAAYGCIWYHRSPEVKKLLQIIIMRAQKPVQFTANSFYVVSLETLGDIFNKVYAFFTVLKGMFE